MQISRRSLLLSLSTALIATLGDRHRVSATLDLQALLDTSMEELRLKTQMHQASWGLGRSQRWDINLNEGILWFTFADGRVVSCPAQIIGTFNTADNSWLWSWANSSIPNALKQDALQVRAFGQQNGLSLLTQSGWTGTEFQAWEMTALAVHLRQAQGAYRGPTGSTLVFISFGEITIGRA